MSESSALPAPTAAEIEIAIDEVLSALVAYRKEPPESAQRARDRRPTRDTFATLGIAELVDTPPEIHRARDLTSSPVETGLKKSLRELGKLLHDQVGDAEMHVVAERVCLADESNFGRRMSPLDSAWNGIGSWVS